MTWLIGSQYTTTPKLPFHWSMADCAWKSKKQQMLEIKKKSRKYQEYAKNRFNGSGHCWFSFSPKLPDLLCIPNIWVFSSDIVHFTLLSNFKTTHHSVTKFKAVIYSFKKTCRKVYSFATWWKALYRFTKWHQGRGHFALSPNLIYVRVIQGVPHLTLFFSNPLFSDIHPAPFWMQQWNWHHSRKFQILTICCVIIFFHVSLDLAHKLRYIFWSLLGMT